MKIAVEGCCHGQLDSIYEHISNLESTNGYKVHALLICGDFQAIRNHQDLQCMAVPPKFRHLGTFHKYYTGEKVAPLLTIVIGGNHEASNYFWELYHGGWIAPNIYFLGHAGCVRVNGIRIAGASGIFKGRDFRKGTFEKLPYDNESMRSVYHIREYCVRRLSLLTSPTIFLSHDWPQGIEHHGDLRMLLKRKPYFRNDIENGNLGSPPLTGLLHALKPDWWFSAHLHTRFTAEVMHDVPRDSSPVSVTQAEPVNSENPEEIKIDDDDDFGDVPEPQVPVQNATHTSSNPDEITLDDEVDEVAVTLQPPKVTQFLALDKCLPKRAFLEVVDVPTQPSTRSEDDASNAEVDFTFDPEWLAILRAFHPLLSTTRFQQPFPPEDVARAMVSESLAWVQANVSDLSVSAIQKFVMTAPGPSQEEDKLIQPPSYTNPQTVALCEMLGLENQINPSLPTETA